MQFFNQCGTCYCAYCMCCVKPHLILFLHKFCASRRPSGFHGDAPDKEVKAEEGNDESKTEGVKKVSN